MKKFIVFLMIILGINIFSLVHVNAASFGFYEGEFIDGVWVTKAKGGTRYYQKARFLRQGNGGFAYCIEPFTMFNDNGTYTESLTADNLSAAQMKRISLIAYFGYTYGNHHDAKWYAISQYMIWKEADNSGDIYFTDSLDGNRIDGFRGEINEINRLINNYLTKPSIANKEFNMVEGSTITLTDTNNVLSNYTTNSKNASISGNKLIITGLEEGEHTINLVRNMRRNTNIPLFYNSSNSQNLMTLGDVENINVSLKVNVEKTTVEVTKIDSDTKTTKPSGDASLSGAVYQIYDSDMNEVSKLEIDDDMKANIENLNYGKYYIKELSPGVGYLLDENIYEFEITHENKDIFLELENEVIKKEVMIHKTYGDGTNGDNEKGIGFDIFNKRNELVTTITTDNNGYAKVILPFGRYTFKQKNTTPGYKYADDFSINIEDSEEEVIYLYDYKIKVPNTSKNNTIFITILLLIFGGYFVKKTILD